jgi:hypothetical protein
VWVQATIAYNKAKFIRSKLLERGDALKRLAAAVYAPKPNVSLGDCQSPIEAAF